MKNNEFFLGIDLGTSSVKGILRSTEGISAKARCKYASNTPQGWTEAITELILRLKNALPCKISAIGLSAQTGTYVINGKDVIGWQDSIGREETDLIRATVPQEDFERCISMRHPDIISYPLPRLLYIQKNYGEKCEVLMPKDLLIKQLTGSAVTDPFTMRGAAELENGNYATELFERLGIKIKLPPLVSPFGIAGRVSASAATLFGLEENTPVYTGCNDFFAGLLGMGVYDVGTAFELSGTSAHVGYISDRIVPQGHVSGKYLNGYCTYGGTKSGGCSCAFAIDNFGIDDLSPEKHLKKSTPIFLPYLKGERAPIYDEYAKGVYFGITDNTDKAQLAYAALEGVVFSMYHVASSMDMPTPKQMICGGGSTANSFMNILRASLFGCGIRTVKESDSSALGACMAAMVGSGAYNSLRDAVNACVEYGEAVLPDARYTDLLRKRFEIYKKLYGDLKDTFELFSKI